MKGTFAGANIRSNPKMNVASVRHDFKILMAKADVFVVQEFTLRFYWAAIAALAKINWASYPGIKSALAHPTRGGQAIFWKRALFEKLTSYSFPAFDFEKDHAGIMDNRWIHAVLLKNKRGKFASWYLTTHFVVGGDAATDSSRRKEFMAENIDRLDHVLSVLERSGYAIMGEIDGNIHKNTWAYSSFMSVMNKHRATLHGDLGVEYSFTIPGQTTHYTDVSPSIIPTSSLRTDHEVRVLDWKGVPE